jgi:hypothetical protein
MKIDSVNYSLLITEPIYACVLMESFPKELHPFRDEYTRMRQKEPPPGELRKVLVYKGINIKDHPEVSELYLKYLCQLDSHSIDFIIEAHENGEQPRSPITIHRLTDELFERYANSETKGYHE